MSMKIKTKNKLVSKKNSFIRSLSWKKNNRKKNIKYKDQIRKKKHYKLWLKDEIETNKTLTKRPGENKKVKEEWPNWKKNIIYNKLELRTKLKIKISSRKGQRKKIRNLNNKDQIEKI